MIRIVTSSTFAALLSDRDELARTRSALDAARKDVDHANGLAEDRRRSNLVLARDLRDAQDDAAKAREAAAAAARRATDAEDGTVTLVRQVTRERDTAREEAAAVNDVREDLARLRELASDTERGSSVRGAIAYGVLRDLITNARKERVEQGEGAGLPRPFDVIAMVLGFDQADVDTDQDDPVRVETATR